MKLTDTEQIIFDCKPCGASTKETARQLGISTETVKTHLRSIKIKTEAKNLIISAANTTMLENVWVLVEALRAADEYLSDNNLNQIGSGSILHKQMQDALAKHGAEK